MTEDPKAVQAALDQLADALAGSDFRAQLRDDPKGAASSINLAEDDLPEGLLLTLALMSEEELRVVAHVQGLFKGTYRDDLSSVAILF